MNVLRDQLDRYGEIDTTAQLIQRAALSSDVFVYSALDPLLVSVAKIASEHKCRVISFGVRDELIAQVANEQSTHGSAVVQSDVDILLESVTESDASQRLQVSSGAQSGEMQIPVRASITPSTHWLFMER